MNTPDILSFDTYRNCILCPRMCKADRSRAAGYCGCSSVLTAARAALHHWEEPCISGSADADGGLTAPGGAHSDSGGSGTVFFSGCTLGCCFCQNHKISSGHFGREMTAEELGQVFLRLQDQGAYNINLVTPTQYLPHIISALDQVRFKLTIPVVYNCGGYERVETVKALNGYVDIWLPDLKYYSSRLSACYSKAPDYFEKASAAILQMIRQTGTPEFISFQDTEDPEAPACTLMKKGVIIRHMVLPGAREDSIFLLHWMKEHLPEGQYNVSLMSQYTPFYNSGSFPEINRRITSYEYYKVVDTAIELGLVHGFMQEKSSAKEEYTPPFDLEGLE